MLRRHTKFDFVGSLHFVTTVAKVRSDWFVKPVICQAILGTLEKTRELYDLTCFGYVLMPDHLHVVLKQENESKTIPAAMKSFKGFSSRKIMKPLLPFFEWQDHYDDVLLSTREAFQTRVSYMVQNPIRAGIVKNIEDYQWSSLYQHATDNADPITLCGIL